MRPETYRRLSPERLNHVLAHANDSRNRKVKRRREDRLATARAIVQAYHRKGISYRQMEVITGVDHQTLWNIDNRRRTPVQATVDRLSAAMVRDSKWLLGGAR